MRILLIGIVLFVQSLEAQQPKRPQPTFVKRQHDASADSVVRLLGEDSASKRDRLRLLDENVRVCTAATVTGALGKRASIAVDARVGGFIAIPAEWTSEPIPALSESVTGESTRLVALVSGKPTADFGKRTQVYVYYTPDEGYPDVQLLKNSKVLATSECRTSLRSTQRGGLIHVSVMTPERGLLQYVLGYAKLNDSTWISYLASSADADEVGVLKAIFTSLVVNPTR